ncbi:hypothetical protein [Amycolatopsis sp. NPDC098790]|uniref:hypothetical protein n=1 Tax=Amycolatopsis sp. NPDC098790 TaxID=3363939 RepID=UPI003815CCF2
MHGPDITTAVSSDRPLYDNYRAMAIANGVDPTSWPPAPAWTSATPCSTTRPCWPAGSPRPETCTSLATNTTPCGLSALEVLRAFVVERHGEDLGPDTTDVADDLRHALASAGVLNDAVFVPVSLVREHA